MGRRTAAAILVCVMTAACGGSGGGVALVAPAGTHTYTFDVVPADVVAVGLPPLTVRRNVTVVGVSVSYQTGITNLLLSMVSFVACQGCPARRPSVGYPTVMGGMCTDVWPVQGKNGLGPTYRARNLPLRKNEQPSVLVYLKAPAAHTVVNDIVVAYRVGKSGPVKALHLPVRIDIRPKPAGAKSVCAHDSIWFGGPAGADKVVPLH